MALANDRAKRSSILKQEDDSEDLIPRFQPYRRQIILKTGQIRRTARHNTQPANFAPREVHFTTKSPLIIDTSQPLSDAQSIELGIQPPPGLSPSKVVMDSEAPEFIPSSSPIYVRSQLEELRGQIARMSLQQQTSRYLQNKLQTLGPDDKNLVFSELLQDSDTIILDVFGNYVIQKMVEYGTRQQRASLVHKMLGKVVNYSLNIYGCRVVQKVFQYADTTQGLVLVQEFRGHVETCITDQNGNHVIQKAIQNLPYHGISFIVDILTKRPIFWSMHTYGCRVMQKVIECCPRENTYNILQMLLINVVDISQDPFGNYVIQHLFDKGNSNDRNQIINSFVGRLFELSKHKFASNVIEKCLVVANPDQANLYAYELFSNERVIELMVDKFGNFVIQKAIEVTRGEAKKMVVKKITENASTLKNVPVGKYVLACVEKHKKIN